ncbi:thioredoxin domain-containing protein [Mycoplasma sp. Mirounga ES2805-ORL]|uniref:thioredoxin domain-containing protein n=1 Tax=Mycoplasma sp. Mirounga ES2805-ORL TaxID=754514 RepID=UPI00197B8088|nr:thioredoxin domain-containing protein [Mycoplasma sp. Mirounga ES2805-ORL]QSF13966.1 hypothetical protein JXZ90_01610 [Mycoplasma sp. Mirounga ES2805-ORL]
MIRILFKDVLNILLENKNSDILYVLYFSKKNCFKLKQMEVILKEISKLYSNNKNIVFYEIDAEEAGVYRDPFAEFSVLEIPTFIFVKNNIIKKNISNFWPKDIFIDIIEEFLD